MVPACVALEYVQNVVNPARVFDVEDIMYNVFGVIFGVLVCCGTQATMTGRRRRRVDLEVATPLLEDEVDGFVNIHMREVE